MDGKGIEIKCFPGVENLALAVSALEEIKSFFADMGGTAYRDWEMTVFPSRVIITSSVEISVSRLSEYISQSAKQGGNSH